MLPIRGSPCRVPRRLWVAFHKTPGSLGSGISWSRSDVSKTIFINMNSTKALSGTWPTVKYVSIWFIQSLIVKFVPRSYRSTSHFMFSRIRYLAGFRNSVSMRNCFCVWRLLSCCPCPSQGGHRDRGLAVPDSIHLPHVAFQHCESCLPEV